MKSLSDHYFDNRKLKNRDRRTTTAITRIITKGNHCLYKA